MAPHSAIVVAWRLDDLDVARARAIAAPDDRAEHLLAAVKLAAVRLVQAAGGSGPAPVCSCLMTAGQDAACELHGPRRRPAPMILDEAAPIDGAILAELAARAGVRPAWPDSGTASGESATCGRCLAPIYRVGRLWLGRDRDGMCDMIHRHAPDPRPAPAPPMPRFAASPCRGVWITVGIGACVELRIDRPDRLWPDEARRLGAALNTAAAVADGKVPTPGAPS